MLPEAIRAPAQWSDGSTCGRPPARPVRNRTASPCRLSEHFPHLAGWDVRILWPPTCRPPPSTGLARDATASSSQSRTVGRSARPTLPPRRSGLAAQRRRSQQGRVPCLPDRRLAGPAAHGRRLPAQRADLLRHRQQTARAAALRRLLAPGGVLFLGGAETTLHLDEGFERVPGERSSYYRVRQA